MAPACRVRRRFSRRHESCDMNRAPRSSLESGVPFGVRVCAWPCECAWPCVYGRGRACTWLYERGVAMRVWAWLRLCEAACGSGGMCVRGWMCMCNLSALAWCQGSSEIERRGPFGQLRGTCARSFRGEWASVCQLEARTQAKRRVCEDFLTFAADWNARAVL